MTQERINLYEPELSGNEAKYLQECIDTGWVSSVGKYVDAFEEKVAQYVGAKHAVACTNGTSALHVSLVALGITCDEEVIMPGLSFISPANAIRYVGAWPVFLDVDQETGQLSAQEVARFLSESCNMTPEGLMNTKTGRKVKAIMPVHLLGHPVDIDPLVELAQKYSLLVIEDAAEGIGAEYKGKKIGQLSGGLSCFSFNGNKIITCGGGGMIVTNDAALAAQLKYLTTQAKDDPMESVHHTIGYNYRLTNIQAAVGVAQLEQLDDFVEKKRKIAEWYESGLGGVEGVVMLKEQSWAKSTYWLNTILIDEKKYGQSSRELMKYLKENNIDTRPLWCPLNRLPMYKDAYAGTMNNVDLLYKQALSLPSSVSLTEREINIIISLIEKGKG